MQCLALLWQLFHGQAAKRLRPRCAARLEAVACLEQLQPADWGESTSLLGSGCEGDDVMLRVIALPLPRRRKWASAERQGACQLIGTLILWFVGICTPRHFDWPR
jgi:hypothetical protein